MSPDDHLVNSLMVGNFLQPLKQSHGGSMQVAALIKQVEQINKAIEEVEALVNNRAK